MGYGTGRQAATQWILLQQVTLGTRNSTVAIAESEGERERQTDRQTDRQVDRQTDRQTDREYA